MICLTGSVSQCEGKPAPGARYCIKHYVGELHRAVAYQKELREKLEAADSELARLLKQGASYFKEVPQPEPSP